MSVLPSYPEHESALLPCPFCGEKRIYLNEPSEGYRHGSINCPACLVVMPGEVRDRDELISCWNAREPVLTGLQEDLILMSFHNEPAPRPLSDAQRPTESTAVEQFQARIVEMVGDGCTMFHLSVGGGWQDLNIEDRCKYILEMWGAPKRPLDIKDSYAVPSTASGSVVQTEQLREALTLGRDAIMESFEHIASRDDQILADARLQSIDAAIAGQPRTHFVSLPVTLVQRLRDHLEQTDSFVWLDEIEMLGVALSSTHQNTPTTHDQQEK